MTTTTPTPRPRGRPPSHLENPIQRARLARGWTQHTLAEICSVHPGSIANWERGCPVSERNAAVLRSALSDELDGLEVNNPGRRKHT